ncbi:MAG: hypothetical protein KIH89_003975 [Candidatus Shapirobacteria bacterium]|nr:hypothetical protein [Candidatus Shapirobacteria bacterium]
MNKNKISLYFIFIAIFTTITGFVLIVQKSYANLIGPSQNIDTSQLLNKIDSNLDTSIIQEIQNRPEIINSGEINFIIDTQTVSPSPVKNQSESSVSSKIKPAISE